MKISSAPQLLCWNTIYKPIYTFHLYTWAHSAPYLTAHSDTEFFNLPQTKGPRPKLYQNVILPHINLVNSKSAGRQQKTLTPQ